MSRKDREMLEDIIDDLVDRLVGAVLDKKQVTLPQPIRVTRGNEDRG